MGKLCELHRRFVIPKLYVTFAVCSIEVQKFHFAIDLDITMFFFRDYFH